MFILRPIRKLHATLVILAALAGTSFAGPGDLVLKLSVLDSPVLASARSPSSARASESKQVRLGEPVSIRLELGNPGADPVTILRSLDPSAGIVSILIQPEDAPARRFTTARWET